ncbi:P-loop containing nucleoside triphosphate hydrolase protein, partial [Mortierella sp. GBAus27b]
NLRLNKYEQIIASHVIRPKDVKVTFAGKESGTQHVSSLLSYALHMESCPLKYPQLFNGPLCAPKGVLLHGPPGCGKTMLAKAVAKESGVALINITLSTLTSKWFGESNQLVAALFSFAKKWQPVIIFIDEIDSLLRARMSHDHQALSMLKAEFMTLWDGLATDDGAGILVLGATNRPFDIDPAFLRRMPLRYEVKLPTEEQRIKILKMLLRSANLEEGFDFDTLAGQTVGFSGSDLKEACRKAAMRPVMEYVRSKGLKGNDRAKLNMEDVRQLSLSDFVS